MEVESLRGLSGQFAIDTVQGISFQVKKVAPGWQSPPDDLRLHTGKPQEQDRLGRLCGAALIRCCGGDKTSDSLIDGLADITIPCESTEWPMPGPHF